MKNVSLNLSKDNIENGRSILQVASSVRDTSGKRTAHTVIILEWCSCFVQRDGLPSDEMNRFHPQLLKV